MKLGVGGTPLDYVIQRGKPLGWHPQRDAHPKHEWLIYEVRLTGSEFQKDKKTVYNIIKAALLAEPAYEWIRKHETTRDGRAAIRHMVNHFEGADMKSR